MEFEILVFRQEVKASQETLDKFHARLKQVSEVCSFYDVDTEWLWWHKPIRGRSSVQHGEENATNADA